eukprot:NODE_1741_length_2388_cov_11.970809.p1 GENE.NODE_1741_length_2388_cov_11.970809~~NODE_1741_length_2388_cov_11.970809.p1  ORF type:complete len:591 (+),score=94.21 NODE_1741_length_2388_cov_11.970809:165-1937(+)
MSSTRRSSARLQSSRVRSSPWRRAPPHTSMIGWQSFCKLLATSLRSRRSPLSPCRRGSTVALALSKADSQGQALEQNGNATDAAIAGLRREMAGLQADFVASRRLQEQMGVSSPRHVTDHHAGVYPATPPPITTPVAAQPDTPSMMEISQASAGGESTVVRGSTTDAASELGSRLVVVDHAVEQAGQLASHAEGNARDNFITRLEFIERRVVQVLGSDDDEKKAAVQQQLGARAPHVARTHDLPRFSMAALKPHVDSAPFLGLDQVEHVPVRGCQFSPQPPSREPPKTSGGGGGAMHSGGHFSPQPPSREPKTSGGGGGAMHSGGHFSPQPPSREPKTSGGGGGAMHSGGVPGHFSPQPPPKTSGGGFVPERASRSHAGLDKVSNPRQRAQSTGTSVSPERSLLIPPSARAPVARRSMDASRSPRQGRGTASIAASASLTPATPLPPTLSAMASVSYNSTGAVAATAAGSPGPYSSVRPSTSPSPPLTPPRSLLTADAPSRAPSPVGRRPAASITRVTSCTSTGVLASALPATGGRGPSPLNRVRTLPRLRGEACQGWHGNAVPSPSATSPMHVGTVTRVPSRSCEIFYG